MLFQGHLYLSLELSVRTFKINWKTLWTLSHHYFQPAALVCKNIELQSELSICNHLLLCNWCIVVPESLQKQTLEKIHNGHQGIQKRRSRASTAMWWPGMSNQISTVVKSCVECSKHARLNCEPMITTPLPEHPWQVVGSPQRRNILIGSGLFFQISRNLQAFHYYFTKE